MITLQNGTKTKGLLDFFTGQKHNKTIKPVQAIINMIQNLRLTALKSAYFTLFIHLIFN